jgi:oligopeptide transport system permease protein
MHGIPGNPWSNYATSPRALSGISMDRAVLRELNRHFGFDLPLWRQFTRYVFGDRNAEGEIVCGAICGNLGPSIRQRGRTVQQVLFAPPEGKGFWSSRFGYSTRLMLFGSLLAVGLGIALGILSAPRPNAAFSRTITIALAALISIPNFVLGLLAMTVLASWLKLITVLPNWGNPSHWVVPAIVLAVMPMASIARITRASLLNVLNEDYVRTAHAKGLRRRRVMLVHVMRNAAVPIITYLGPALLEMATGLLIVESLYAFPGFGREFWEAVLALDYPMIMGLTLMYATGIALISIAVEVVCGVLDPRIRLTNHPGAP